MSDAVFSPYTLPNGAVIKNRIVKAAMEENMATSQQLPGSRLYKLYRTWAEGGVGLIITGNVMVDRLAMTGPGGVVLDANSNLKPFQTWAQKAKRNGARIWMQINHPGRQVFKAMSGKALAPSAVALNMGKHSNLFAQPKAMTTEEITDVIKRFVITATRAKQAGFDGVEIHAAHGYLLAQFLSPLTNHRTDEWGGSLKNRAKLLLTIVEKVRQACGKEFDLAIKLNSADFQRGGFDIADAEQVVSMLEVSDVDMVELSGGSYEAPAMQGRTADDRTLEREAYFLIFAEQIAQSTSIPIMTTGGIRQKATAEKVLTSGISLVGMASALAYNPDLPNQWQQGNLIEGHIPDVSWQDKTLKGLAVMALVKSQLKRIAVGKLPKTKSSPFLALVCDQLTKTKLTKRYRRNIIEQ